MDNMLNKWRALSGRLAAEFAIVALGVTIALWADGWVANRSDRAEEIARLHALQDNVTETLGELNIADDNASGAARALRELASPKHSDHNNEDVEDLLRYGLLYGANFYPELNVYHDLKASGELALLTNRDLRQSLATMDTRLELVRLAQADLVAVQQLNVDSYMIKRLDLRLFYGPLLELYNISEDSEMDLEFSSDMEFRNVILLKLDLVTQLQIGFRDAEDALVSVQRAIATQLETQSN